MKKISAEQWRDVFALLDTALDLSPAARPAWLDSLADTPVTVTDALRDLLARRTAEGFLENLPQFTGVPEASSDASPETLTVDSTVGPYRLLRRLGRGGMSSVWMATRIDGMLSRRVAIKLPHVSWAVPEAARRMERERDLLGSLEHPHIARLYDAGVSADGRPFLAMEYVDGLALDEFCKVGAVDVPTRVSLIAQTARAVAHAHSRGIIHRDLKPANILVDSSGQVRLLDFGIGKLLETGTAAGDETQFVNRLFTPDFASPEQLRGAPVSTSTDVFSLGVVLYQILCGQMPDRQTGIELAPPSRACVDPAMAGILQGDLDAIAVGSSRVDLQACKLEYSIVSPK